MSPAGDSRSYPRPAPKPDAYTYRRPLAVRELLPAIGAGVVVGVAAFYVARILLQRTPFLPVERPVTLAPARRR
jgi:hypothetical protein